ncbi:acyltransferase family protein [Raoultella terrigena]|uniref:acyltransferase family protein n=1 Tax=Raoultella terrigena TaxID=577 RepID=UPI002F933382
MTKSSALTYRPDIDGLRAIAVMAVLLYHAFPTIFRSGYIGVDIFFVISGFLITTIIRKEIKSGVFTLSHFYKKRIRRIYPALIVTLLAVLFLSWFLLSTPEFTVTLKHIIFSSLFTENFLLWSEDGYFDKASIFKPTLHIWSLSIEEQFYIFWPFIIVFLVKRNVEIKGICFFIIVSFLINIYDIYNHPAAAYYSPLGRSWELMVGSLFAILYTDVKSKGYSDKNNSVLAVIGFILVLVSVFFIPTQTYFPGFSAIPVVLGAALIIFYSENTIISRILSLKWVVFIGLISYPLYLVHWPLMSFSSIIIGHDSSKANAICLIISLVIAIAIYSLIEKRIAKQKLTVAYTLFGVMVIVPLSAFLLIGTQSRINEVKLPTENEWTFLKENHYKFGLKEFNSNGTGFYTLTSKNNDSYYFLGDSHMANLAEYIYEELHRSNNPPGVVMAAGGGCIPIPNVYTDDSRRKNCWEMRASALEKIRDHNNIKNVVIGAAWYMYFFNRKDYFYEDSGGKYPLNTPKGMQLAVDSMMTTIKELSATGKNVFFIKDAPYILDVSPGIFRMRLQPYLSYNAHENLNIPLEKGQVNFISYLEQKAQESGAKIIDIFDKVCNSEGCKVIDDGEYIYADSGHFNPSWLRKNQYVLNDIKL